MPYKHIQSLLCLLCRLPGITFSFAHNLVRESYVQLQLREENPKRQSVNTTTGIWPESTPLYQNLISLY